LFLPDEKGLHRVNQYTRIIYEYDTQLYICIYSFNVAITNWVILLSIRKRTHTLIHLDFKY